MDDLPETGEQFNEGASHLHQQVDALNEEVKLKSFLLDNISDSVILADLDGDIFYANQTAYESKGWWSMCA